MSEFPRMTDIVQESQAGIARIEHFEVSDADSKFSALRRGYVRPGKYARLYVGGCLMMSDTDMERGSNMRVLLKSHGNVLIAGLGIGMILHPILAKPEVVRVTVVEKCQDVIDLVSPTLTSAKMSIINADIFQWKPPKGEKWNTIYFDIWPDICTDNLTEMATLHRRFSRRLVAGGWMGSWMKDTLLYYRRKEKGAGCEPSRPRD